MFRRWSYTRTVLSFSIPLTPSPNPLISQDGLTCIWTGRYMYTVSHTLSTQGTSACLCTHTHTHTLTPNPVSPLCRTGLCRESSDLINYTNFSLPLAKKSFLHSRDFFSSEVCCNPGKAVVSAMCLGHITEHSICCDGYHHTLQNQFAENKK